MLPPKVYNPLFFLVVIGALVTLSALSISTWANFEKEKTKDAPPGKLVAGIVVCIVALAIIAMPLLPHLFAGFMQMVRTPISLVGAAAFAGILVVLFTLQSKYTGDLVYAPDRMSATCPSGAVLRRTKANNCEIMASQCTGNPKKQDIWSWWQVPALSIGAPVLAIVVVGAVVKSGGKLIM